MSLFSFGAIIFGDKSKLIDWMKNKGLLASSMDCQKCTNGTAMVFTERTEQGGSKDGYTWRCTHCHTMKTIRAGSFFCKIQVAIEQMGLPAILVEHGCGCVHCCTSSRNIRGYSSGCVPVLQRRLLHLAHKCGPAMLGGNGVVVQIDESLFVHKCKVSRKVVVLGAVMTNYGHSNN